MGCKFKSPSAFFSLSWGASWALVASVWGWGWGHKLWRIADQAEFLEELPLVPGSGLVWAGEIVKLKDSWPLNCGPRVSTNTSWETNVRGDSGEVPRWGMLWALQEMHSWQVFEVLGSYSGCKGAGNPPPTPPPPHSHWERAHLDPLSTLHRATSQPPDVHIPGTTTLTRDCFANHFFLGLIVWKGKLASASLQWGFGNVGHRPFPRGREKGRTGVRPPHQTQV